MKPTVALALTLSLFAVAPAVEAQDVGFKVIVNNANPVSSLSTSGASNLFLKREKRWESGQPVLPVDLTESAPARALFTESIHGRSINAIKAYWQRQLFSGRGVPPVQRQSDEEVVDYVAANENAIGYVSADTNVGNRVKVVLIQ